MYTETSIDQKLVNDQLKKEISHSIRTQAGGKVRGAKVIRSARENGTVYILMEFYYITPPWFELQNLPKDLFEIVGYGAGASLKEAKEDALRDIASQIKVQLTSSLTIGTNIDGDKLKKQIDHQIQTRTDAQLKNAKVIKSDRVGKEFFVAVRSRHIPDLPCETKQNPYLEKTLLIERLNSLTKCPYDFELLRKNGRWHLIYHTLSEPLAPKHFDELLVNSRSDDLLMLSDKSHYAEDDLITLEITSKKTGHLSLFVVYEDGKVGILADGAIIFKNQPYRFPEPDSGLELVAGLTETREPTKDLYVAVVTESPLNLGRFEQIENDLLGDGEYRFGELLQLLEGKNFSTLLLRTTP